MIEKLQTLDLKKDSTDDSMNIPDQTIKIKPQNVSNSYEPDAPWRLRYWAIFAGQGSSLIGSALTQFVLLWWITDTTNDISALASAGIAALLPQAIFGPLGGAFADRYSRRAIMILTDTISAGCMILLIVLFLTGSVQLWQVYLMMAVRSAMQAFQSPAATASTAMLVPISFLPRAAGLNQTLTGLMTVAAAPLGALAISAMPVGFALSIDVVTALLGIVPLLIYEIPQAKEISEKPAGLWGEFKQGVQFVWNSPGLRRMYGLLAAVVLVIMPSFTLVPLLVKEHFGGGAGQVAMIEGIGGAGMIAGGIVIAAIAPRKFSVWILSGFSVSCFALALTALVPGDYLPVAIVFWVISSVAFIMGNSPLMTAIQTIVPNHMQGRVLSLLTTVTALAAPFGIALAAPLGKFIGVRWLFVVMGILGGMVSLLGFLSPAILNIHRAKFAPFQQKNSIDS